MLKLINRKSAYLGAAFTTGMLMSSSAQANNFGSIAGNITNSISNLPGLLSALAYMFGILLGVLGVLKIKDHVENPGNAPLKDGAIRLAAGGALFALPIIYQAMQNTVGSGSSLSAQTLKGVSSFNSVN